jgi:alpha-mannosidase
MQSQYRKVKKYLQILDSHRWQNVREVKDVFILPTEYKTDNRLPDKSLFSPYEIGAVWGAGYDTHAWFRFTLPPVRENTFLHVQTDRRGWDATNPQFIVYLDGRMVQGMDTNHLEVLLEANKETEVYLYGYVGNESETARQVAPPPRFFYASRQKHLGKKECYKPY